MNIHKTYTLKGLNRIELINRLRIFGFFSNLNSNNALREIIQSICKREAYLHI